MAYAYAALYDFFESPKRFGVTVLLPIHTLMFNPEPPGAMWASLSCSRTLWQAGLHQNF